MISTLDKGRRPADALPSRRNLVALDGVRGLAILAVLLFHLQSPAAAGGFISEIVRWIFRQGWAGVDLFFVLSGFLITGILIDTCDCGNYLRSFYSRRALRIFPLFYTFLLVVWLASLAFPSFSTTARWLPPRVDWWLYPTYLMNWQALWKSASHHSIMEHFWSLAVEEQFYFCWPLIVLLIRGRRLLHLLATLELAILIGRSWWVFQHGASYMLFMATITRMDGLMFGAACAVVVREFRIPQRLVVAMPRFSALCLATYSVAILTFGQEWEDRFKLYGGLALLAAGFAGIVLFAVCTDSEQSRMQTWLRWKPLTRVGKYAYGLYVLHVPIYNFISQFVLQQPIISHSAPLRYSAILLKLVLSYAVASISYNYFEKRFLALKERFEPEYPKASMRSVEVDAFSPEDGRTILHLGINGADVLAQNTNENQLQPDNVLGPV